MYEIDKIPDTLCPIFFFSCWCLLPAVSILETRHQTFCKKLVEGNGCSAEQSYHHKRQKQMNMNGNDEIALPCARALALAHNNLALVLVNATTS